MEEKLEKPDNNPNQDLTTEKENEEIENSDLGNYLKNNLLIINPIYCLVWKIIIKSNLQI